MNKAPQFTARELATATLILLGKQHYENVRTIYTKDLDAPDGTGANLDFHSSCILLSKMEVTYPSISVPADTKENQIIVLEHCRSERNNLQLHGHTPEEEQIFRSGKLFFSMLNIARITREVIEAIAFYKQHPTTFQIVPNFKSALYAVITGREFSEDKHNSFSSALENAANHVGTDDLTERIYCNKDSLNYDPLAESVMIAAYQS